MRATVWLDRKSRVWRLTVLHGCRVDTLPLWDAPTQEAAELAAEWILEANGLAIPVRG